MPKPRLLISSTLRSVRHEILQRDANQNPPLVLVPGYAAVRGWRKVAQKYFSHGCALPHFATTEDWFIEAALASADKPLRFITPAQRRLVLRSLLASLKPQLNELKNLVDSNQFLQQIDQWMAHLFEANVQSWPDSGGPWSRDLQIILQNYNSWKQRQSGAELWDVEFAPRISSQSASAYPNLPHEIIVEAAISPTPNQCAGFKSLISCCDSFTATLAVPGISKDSQSWPQLLDYVAGSALEDTVKFWQAQDAELEVVTSDIIVTANKLTDLNALAASRTTSQKNEPSDSSTSNALSERVLSISSAHTPRQEIHEMATSIREQSTDIQGASKSVVLLNNPSRYSDVLKSTFAEYGLPLRRSPGQSLVASPLVQKWMQLLNLSKRHWKVSALVDVFSGGALAFTFDDHKMDVRRIEKASAVLRQYSLNDLGELSDLLNKSTFTREIEVDDTKKDIEVLAALQQRLVEINSADDHQNWLQLVTQLWNEVTVHWKNETSKTAEIAKLHISDVQFVLQSLKQSMGSWQKYFSEDSGVWQSQLNLALTEAKSSGDVGIRSGVDAVLPRQLIQDVPEVVYWPGMLEADYPSITKGALQSRHQKTINHLCPHLPSPTAQSIYWIALALADADKIYFSWPKYCDDRTSLASVLLEDIWQPDSDEEKQDANEIEELPPSQSVVTGKDKRYFSHPQNRHDLGTTIRQNKLVPPFLEKPLPQQLWKMHQARNSLELNSFDGSLSDGEGLMETALRQNRKPLSHSATSLKTYAQCGLKYYFQKVLLLEDRPGISLLLEQNEVGNVIHSVLEKLYTRFHHPLNADNKSAAWELLKQLSQDEVAKLLLPAVLQKVELSRLIGAGGDEPHGILGRYLLGEIELRETDWQNSIFTQPMRPFGLSGLSLPGGLERAYEAKFRLKLDAITLEGKFDRLDVSNDGSVVLAVDYKTGRYLPAGKHAPDGIEFQLPLYLWALEQLFAQQDVQVAGAFYSLVHFAYQSGVSHQGVLQKFPGKRASNADPGLKKEAEWNEFMNLFSQQVQQIDRLINQGQFPISVRPASLAGCEYCVYKNICFRNEELQATRRDVLWEDKMIYTEVLPLRNDAKEASE